jgi:hypothetical protein
MLKESWRLQNIKLTSINILFQNGSKYLVSLQYWFLGRQISCNQSRALHCNGWESDPARSNRSWMNSSRNSMLACEDETVASWAKIILCSTRPVGNACTYILGSRHSFYFRQSCCANLYIIVNVLEARQLMAKYEGMCNRAMSCHNICCFALSADAT